MSERVQALIDAKLEELMAETGGGKSSGETKPRTRIEGMRESGSSLAPVETPSAIHREVVDAKLKHLAGLCSRQEGVAWYGLGSWEQVVDTVGRYTLDVCEGAGLIVADAEAPARFRAALDGLLREMRVAHEGGYLPVGVKEDE